MSLRISPERSKKIENDEKRFSTYEQRADAVQDVGNAIIEEYKAIKIRNEQPEQQFLSKIQNYVNELIKVKDVLYEGQSIYLKGTEKEVDPVLREKVIQLAVKLNDKARKLCKHTNAAFRELSQYVDREVRIRFQFCHAQLLIDGIDYSKLYPLDLESPTHPYHDTFVNVEKFCNGALKEPENVYPSALRAEIKTFQATFRKKIPEKQTHKEEKTPPRNKRRADVLTSSPGSLNSSSSTSSSSSTVSTTGSVAKHSHRQLFPREQSHTVENSAALDPMQQKAQIEKLYNTTLTPEQSQSMPQSLFYHSPLNYSPPLSLEIKSNEDEIAKTTSQGFNTTL